MPLKRGDTVFERSDDRRHPTIYETTVKSIGAKWITTARGTRYSVGEWREGCHAGDFGWRLWHSREHIARVDWSEQTRHKIFDALDFGRTVSFDRLRAVALALGLPDYVAPSDASSQRSEGTSQGK